MQQWNGKVVTLNKFFALDAPEVVRLTPCRKFRQHDDTSISISASNFTRRSCLVYCVSGKRKHQNQNFVVTDRFYGKAAWAHRVSVMRLMTPWGFAVMNCHPLLRLWTRGQGQRPLIHCWPVAVSLLAKACPWEGNNSMRSRIEEYW